DSILIGNGSLDGAYVATYDNLVNESWYNNTSGTGLNWLSSGNEADNGIDWTAPWSFDETVAFCQPHIMTTEQDGTYVANQPCVEIQGVPKTPVTIDNYKIDAMSLNIALHYKIDIKASKKEIKQYLNNVQLTTNKLVKDNLVCDNTSAIIDETKQTITFTNNESTCKINPDTTYTIETINTDYITEEPLIIHTPRQIVIGEEIYALIGDGVNVDTDVEELIKTDVTTPETVETSAVVEAAPAYGVYELESIGYEEANASTSVSNYKADWSDKDLTLTKYNHVIRPLDGNYLIADNIDATISKTDTNVDNSGGFSANGFKPIGTMFGTSDMLTALPFTGELTGDVDTLISTAKDNTYISGLSINEEFSDSASYDYQGLIAKAEGASLNNFGVVDAKVEGGNYVGVVAGNINNGEILNVYVAESIDDSASVTYDVQGTGTNIGGIAGKVTNTSINSNEVFSGKIEGIPDSVLTTQPSNVYPDKDGYKTFSTVDVQGVGEVGGIMGEAEGQLNINNLYAKSTITSTGENTGGIVGKVSANIDEGQKLKIYNTYYNGQLQGTICIGGIVGNINTISSSLKIDKDKLPKISNSYTMGNILGTSANTYAAGTVGKIVKGGVIENVYSIMTIQGSDLLGGILNTDNEGTYYITNNIYNGSITATKNSGWSDVGGITGATPYKGAPTTNIILEIKNNYSSLNINTNDKYTGSLTDGSGFVGHIVGEPIASHAGDGDAVVKNNYYAPGGEWVANGKTYTEFPQDTYLDSSHTYANSTEIPKEVAIENLKTSIWWKETLFQDDEGVNWNIAAEDVENPTDDSDTTDESNNNNLGTVTLGLYPTLKEVDNSGAPTTHEVLEQTSLLLETGTRVQDEVDTLLKTGELAIIETTDVSNMQQQSNKQVDIEITNDPVQDETIKEEIKVEEPKESLTKPTSNMEIIAEEVYGINLE
ncbi:MAG: hypothetical protein ACK5HR_07070, partial [Mycoplasmatales bacterium]